MNHNDDTDSSASAVPNNRTQELILLGEIKGLVQGLKSGQDLQAKRLDQLDQNVQERFSQVEERFDEKFGALETKFDAKLDSIDGRLRTVEQKAAVMGALSGGAMSVGVALIVEGVKAWLNRGGSH